VTLPLGGIYRACFLSYQVELNWLTRCVYAFCAGQMQMTNVRSNQEMNAPQPWAPPPQSFPINAGGGPGYRPPQYMPPQHNYDSYYPRVDMPPPMDKQPRQQAPPSFGRDPPMGPPHTTSMQPQQSIVTKVLFSWISVFSEQILISFKLIF